MSDATQPTSSRTVKPLGIKAYGSICHLPGSRLGPGDHKLNEGQTRILCVKPRDKHDHIIVQEKLDGSNVAVARLRDETIMPLGRAGYPAISSPYEQHRLFAAWVYERVDRFDFLRAGERLCGEWLAQAHGTQYDLTHEPFVPFDLFDANNARAAYDDFLARVVPAGFALPKLLHRGGPLCVEDAMALLGTFGHHGATDPAEGCVWRVERKGAVDFLGKYVRPDKIDGRYLPEISKQDAVWNWRPGSNSR